MTQQQQCVIIDRSSSLARKLRSFRKLGHIERERDDEKFRNHFTALRSLKSYFLIQQNKFLWHIMRCMCFPISLSFSAELSLYFRAGGRQNNNCFCCCTVCPPGTIYGLVLLPTTCVCAQVAIVHYSLSLSLKSRGFMFI